MMVQHYTELIDIKRVVINTHAIEPQVSPVFEHSLSIYITVLEMCVGLVSDIGNACALVFDLLTWFCALSRP